jgi:Raf kinase inhibitor-like YbhB/YbcL family protein
MKLSSASFTAGQPIPSEFAFCRPDPEAHATLAENTSPELSWNDVPVGTRSFALICHDPDVPCCPEDVNQEGRTVPADLDRVPFYHWLLVDIPASVRHLEAGADSDGVTPGGKEHEGGPHGARRGVNDYTKWFDGDGDMDGKYRGYDGPCPPWNDSIRHHYVFTIYALDCERLQLEEDFGGPALLQAIEGHELDRASITGSYSLNPAVPA